MFPGDDLSRAAVLVLRRQPAKPRGLRPLGAEHLLVGCEQLSERSVIACDDGVFCRLPNRGLIDSSAASADFVSEQLPRGEAVLVRDRELGVGELALVRRVRGVPALEKILRLFLVLLEIWARG